MTGFSIGALAAQTGVKVPTIRYYESIGLLLAAPRTDGNRRAYDAAAARRLRFIRHARELGFEVEAIRQLLTLAQTPKQSCHAADEVARAHLIDIDSKIARLQALRAEVARMLDECAAGHRQDCRVIEVLADHGQCLHEAH